MDFLEKDLEQIIYDATEEQLSALELSGRRLRQLKIGNYGVADLVFVEREYDYRYNCGDDYDYNKQQDEYISECGLKITVCELKRDKIGISAFLQALKYCKGISAYLDKRNFFNYSFEIVLIGRDIDTSGSFIYITDMFDNYGILSRAINKVKFFTYSYGFNGIDFKREWGYNLTNKGF